LGVYIPLPKMPCYRFGFCLLFLLIVLCIIDIHTGAICGFTVRSLNDSRSYPVVKMYDNTTEAANTLATLNATNLELIKYMKQKYKTSPYLKHVNRLESKYNPDVLGEHLPIGKNNTSYVVSKGKKIRFCLRPMTNREEIHDINILTFVSLHEISHIMNETIGHEIDFWSVFKFMLTNAVEAGLYTAVNYSLTPVLYCNLTVDYNPLFDNTLPVMPY
jgi:hypothetical protein